MFSVHFLSILTTLKPLPLNKGLPQGSILGPTLFNIYINNITHGLGQSHIHLYADDTILYSFNTNISTALSQIQQSFNLLQHAFSNLRLNLNTSKTKCMLFNRNLPQPDSQIKILSLSGLEIQLVNQYKYLGIWLDSSLAFKTHIDSLLSKVKCRIGFLYRNKASFTYEAKQLLVKATILPILDYGDIVYRSASNTLLNKLDVIYHSAIRFVTGAPYKTHHCKLYSLVKWPSLQTRRKLHWLLFIYKSLIGKLPNYLSSLLQIHKPSRTLRSSCYIRLTVPKTQKEFGKTSFQFSAPNDWNNLQETLKLTSFVPTACFIKSVSAILQDKCTCF